MRRIVMCALTMAGVSVALLAQTPRVEPLVPLPLPTEARFPEGVAFDPARQVLYTASAETGAVVEIALKDGTSRVVVPPGTIAPVATTTFPVALGMKLDSANRLWIAGGRTGRMFVVDLNTGRVVKQVITPAPAASLINDLAIVAGAAYFTDTRTPTMWRMVTKGTQIGDLEAWLSFADTPLQYDANANLNGIAAMPDGRTLIVVQMGKGLLFQIDVESKAVRAIDTTGIDLTGGDGLVLSGSTLYVVRQPAGEIVTLTLQLGAEVPSAKLVSRFRDPLLAWPATAVLVQNGLVVVNSQFNTRVAKTQREPFTLVSVPLSRLAGRR